MILTYNGCLLPLLIVLNFFFGRLFFKTDQWLAIEGVLILLFLLSSYIMTRRIFSSGPKAKAGNVIDVEGEAVEETDNNPLRDKKAISYE